MLSGKRLMIYARVDYQTYSMLEELAEKLGSNLSEAIRQSIAITHALLSSAPEISIGKVVIQNPSVNINLVKQEAVQLVKNENVLKLKREIDQLHRELEKALSENLELKQKLQQLQNRATEQSNQSGELLKKLQQLQERLSDLRFWIAVAVECLERDECDKQKLLVHLKQRIGRYEKPELVQSMINVLRGGL